MEHKLTMADPVQYAPAALNHSYGAPEIVNQRKQTLAALSLAPGQHVLDIGCGTGFLTEMIARHVTASGSVIAMDKSDDMVAATIERCAGISQVSVEQGDVTALRYPEQTFDAVTCTQVLLYVAEIEKAISEMVRVLRPGGKLAVLETDWHGTVMHSAYPDITDRIYASWDRTVASPNLPRRLSSLMKNSGLNNIHATAIPLLNNRFDPANFSVSSLDWLSGNAYKTGAITKQESKIWREDLKRLGERGEYFFCVNRFLFVGDK